VLRSGAKVAAVLTLLGDALKGGFAVYLARGFAPFAISEYAVLGAALGVVIGHMYSCFLRFRGGKGVATAFGVLCALDARLALIAVTIWLLMAAIFRFSSLASITAATAAAIACMTWHHGGPLFFWSVPFVAMFVVWRHRSNIRHLWAGTESRIGSRS
jgi:glycerol-3-phosphate acyltransferase PlsY